MVRAGELQEREKTRKEREEREMEGWGGGRDRSWRRNDDKTV